MTQRRLSIHARRRPTTEWSIQLHFGGAAGPPESSVASDAEDGGRGVGGAVAALRQDVREAGRPSIAPEKLLRALLLQVLYTIRSERQLMEQLDYNMLYRWFVGLNMDDAVWDVTVFTKNRERLLKGDIAQAFFEKVVEQARAQQLLSDEHFTVDGTLIEAWAGQKSFQRKDQPPQPPEDGGSNPTVNFHGEKRSNQTHRSTTDPEARLFGSRAGANPS